jgi:hypothetical protein
VASNSNRNEMLELHNAIHSSKGMAFINQTYARSFSLNIFTGNAEEFIALLREFSDVELSIIEMKRKDEPAATQRFRELNRLFHNFLAGAMTLVDHTRVLVSDKYLGTDVNKEFRTRVDRDFGTNPLTRFVQDLRNYMSHKGMPPVVKSIRFGNVNQDKGSGGSADSGVFLDLDELRKWTGWKADSRKYLASIEGDLSLLALAEEYRQIILSFHKAFDELIYDHHTQDLEALKVLQAAFQGHLIKSGLDVDSTRENAERHTL